jgi:putative ABC transport system permease protein
LKALTSNDNEISRDSRIEISDEFHKMTSVAYILGGVMTAVLSLVGLLNFVSSVSVGMALRRQEFALLQSLGMSQKQLRGMLLWEGCGYALITLLLASTFGNAAVYGIFKIFQNEADYAVFTYPVIPVILLFLAIIIVCIITTETAYKSICKRSIVERLSEE